MKSRSQLHKEFNSVDKDKENALYLYRKYGFTEVLFDGADQDGEYLKLMKRI